MAPGNMRSSVVSGEHGEEISDAQAADIQALLAQAGFDKPLTEAEKKKLAKKSKVGAA